MKIAYYILHTKAHLKKKIGKQLAWIFHLFVARSIETATYTENWKKKLLQEIYRTKKSNYARKPNHMKISNYKN